MKTQTERGIRFDISCEVCRDLMPLVRDGVASADSEALVRAHTERCGGCRTMLESETPPEHSMPDDARVLRRLRWRLLAQSVLFALVGVLGALWLTSRAGDVYLAWWLPLVGAACYYVLRRRSWLVSATAAAFVLLYFFIPNMQSLQWGSVVLYASMALAVAGPLAIGCAIAGLLHFAFGNRKEEKYADGKKHWRKSGRDAKRQVSRSAYENNACAGASVGADSFGRTCMVDMAKDGESADRLVYRTENYRAL